jgi:hypothetical protein
MALIIVGGIVDNVQDSAGAFAAPAFSMKIRLEDNVSSPVKKGTP